MPTRTVVHRASALLLAISLVILAAAPALRAQEPPARRLSSIVGVAVEEYAKGIDERGRTISEQEYQEAADFIADARTVAARLSGDRAPAVRAVLDTLAAAVAARTPPSKLADIHRRFAAALGAEGALEMPTAALDLAAGRRLFGERCASCHGEGGLGDGPAARGMNPPPPAIGDAKSMAAASPALLYRVVSVGIPGTKMPGWSAELTPQERWAIVAYVMSLHHGSADVLEGEGLYLQRCASCHGDAGAGDGPDADALTRLPPDIGSFAWQAERSDSTLAVVTRAGKPGTAMPPSPELSEGATRAVVAYLRSIAFRRGAPPAVAEADTSARAVARKVLATLDQSLAAAERGRAADANDLAFDAYIAFEPLETPARARSPGLVTGMERHFASFKGAIGAGDLRDAQRARDAIEASLPDVVALTRRTGGGWGAFLESLLIIVREGFEAILVIGAVVAFLIKTGHRERLRSIWVGAALGVVASALTAVVLQTVLRAVPASRDLIEGISMLVAVAVLFSVSYWLISKVEAAKWQQFIRDKVTVALEHGGGTALAFVAFLAVYREGAETALFYQALFGEGRGAAVPLLAGIGVGAVVLAVIFTLFYRYGVRIPLRPFFTVTSGLLYLMAFAFAGKGVHELQEVNVLPTTVLRGFPHVEALGIHPTVETLTVQLALLLLLVVALAKTFWPSRSVALPTMPEPASTATEAQVAALEQAVARLEERLAALERGAAALEDEERELLRTPPGDGGGA